jgi:hypothetical protein
MHRFASTRVSRPSKTAPVSREIPWRVAAPCGRYEDGGILRRGRLAVEPVIGIVGCVEVGTVISGMEAGRIAGVRPIRLVPGKDQAIRVRRIVIRRNVDDVFVTRSADRGFESGRRGKTACNRRAAGCQRTLALGVGAALARLGGQAIGRTTVHRGHCRRSPRSTRAAATALAAAAAGETAPARRPGCSTRADSTTRADGTTRAGSAARSRRAAGA